MMTMTMMAMMMMAMVVVMIMMKMCGLPPKSHIDSFIRDSDEVRGRGQKEKLREMRWGKLDPLLVGRVVLSWGEVDLEVVGGELDPIAVRWNLDPLLVWGEVDPVVVKGETGSSSRQVEIGPIISLGGSGSSRS